MRKVKAERDWLGPMGRQPKRAMPGTRSPGVNSHPRVPFSYLVIARASFTHSCHREGKARVVTEPLTLLPHTLSSRGRSPWRSTVTQQAKRQTQSRPSRHSGLPRPSLRSFLAMTKIVLEPNCTPPFLSDLFIARGESPWRSTVIQ